QFDAREPRMDKDSAKSGSAAGMSGAAPPQEAPIALRMCAQRALQCCRARRAHATNGTPAAATRRTYFVGTAKERHMPRGDKSKYSNTQKRKARRIEESYEARGLDAPEAEARAWATVNKQSGGGERSGSGRRTPAKRKAQARHDSARRAVA